MKKYGGSGTVGLAGGMWRRGEGLVVDKEEGKGPKKAS